jgi:hypothetical protein
MTFQPAFNPTDSPVLIDSAGRTLGGGEWGAVNLSDPFAQEASEAGRLVLPDLRTSGATPEALEAKASADRANQRGDQLRAKDAGELARLAVEHGVLTEDAVILAESDRLAALLAPVEALGDPEPKQRRSSSRTPDESTEE